MTMLSSVNALDRHCGKLSSRPFFKFIGSIQLSPGSMRFSYESVLGELGLISMLIRPTIFVHPYHDPRLLTRDESRNNFKSSIKNGKTDHPLDNSCDSRSSHSIVVYNLTRTIPDFSSVRNKSKYSLNL